LNPEPALIAMTSLLENPMPILFFGVFVEAILAGILVHTRRGVLLVPITGVALLVLGGLIVERLVVTERERVEAALDEAVDGLNANDLDRVLGCLSDQAEHTRRRAEWAMARVEFTNVTIHGLEITINDLTSPPTAEARFNGVAHYRDRQGEFPYEHYAARFIVQLQLEDNRWRITDHIEHARGGFGGREE
jgi:hypothetical protein